MHLLTLAQATAIILACSSTAHPGEEHHYNEAISLSKRDFYAHARRGLSACSEKLATRGIAARAAARRRATAQRLSKRASLRTRDTDTILAKSHHSSESYTLDTPESTIFASNSTCILNPEGEIGPYWVKGELIRNDLTDKEPGVPLTIDGQFIDVETCEPIEGLYWDVWNCNSTGVYSGVVQNGNGDSSDTSNLDNTALRGVAVSDSDGVVQFTTIFPGHYSGRTTHIHMVAHLNATLNDNKTLSGGSIPHVGQFFFDQDLITQVEALAPYNTNNATLTTNAEDHVFGEQETTDAESDPVFEYVMLGEDLSDGLLAWITIAVNQSASYDPGYAVLYTADGGVATSGGSQTVTNGSGGVGGNGTMSGNGTMPSSGNGIMPSRVSETGGMATDDASGIIGTATGAATAISTEDSVETTSGAAASTSAGVATSSIATGAACKGINILGWVV